jgi:HEAT repeat protein
LNLAEAVAASTEAPDERALADLRRGVDEELEAAIRDDDFRTRALAYRAIGQLHFAQKTELLRRGMEDESPACRGSALLSLELLSRDHPGLINSNRPLLHKLVNADGNEAVRRLAVLCLKNGSPARDTLVFLDHLTDSDEEKALRDAAASTLVALRKKARDK